MGEAPSEAEAAGEDFDGTTEEAVLR
jgi:hypothetical protein